MGTNWKSFEGITAVSKNSNFAKRTRRTSCIGRIVVLVAYVSCILLAGATPGRAQQTSESGASQPLHIVLGKSVVLNLEPRLKRILISDPAIIDALVTNPHQVVIEAKAVGSSSLILWDESEVSRMLDVTVDLDVAGLRTASERAYPNLTINVRAEGDRLVLSGTVPDQRTEDALVKMAGVYSKQVVDSLDRVAAHQRQILLEVKIAEVDRTKLDQFGINFLSTGIGNTPGVISTQQFGAISGSGGSPLTLTPGAPTSLGISNLLNIFLFRPDANLGVTIQALRQNSVLEILAEPNLMALEGSKASFLAGGEFPFPVVQGGQNVGAVTIQFRPFGVRLDFTGFIGSDDTIRLQVAPEVSSLDFTQALTISGFTVPALSTRRTETEIELKDGQSFGIGGSWIRGPPHS